MLAAAEQLFAARGVAAVSMDDVAAAAGVGKGTLYRRFGDKSGLAAALLDEREAELQAALLSGPPPLGPGASPADRLAAFTAAYLTFVDTHLDLVAMSQTASPEARFRPGSHSLWRQHCRILLTAASAPDPDMRADTLLAALTAEQIRHWRRTEGRPLTASPYVHSADVPPRPGQRIGSYRFKVMLSSAAAGPPCNDDNLCWSVTGSRGTSRIS